MARIPRNYWFPRQQPRQFWPWPMPRRRTRWRFRWWLLLLPLLFLGCFIVFGFLKNHIPDLDLEEIFEMFSIDTSSRITRLGLLGTGLIAIATFLKIIFGWVRNKDE